jgi:hypothetical protein
MAIGYLRSSPLLHLLGKEALDVTDWAGLERFGIRRSVYQLWREEEENTAMTEYGMLRETDGYAGRLKNQMMLPSGGEIRGLGETV